MTAMLYLQPDAASVVLDDDLPPEAGEDIYFPGRQYETVSITLGQDRKRTVCPVLVRIEHEGKQYVCVTTQASLFRYGRLGADQSYFRVGTNRSLTRGAEYRQFYPIDRMHQLYGWLDQLCSATMRAELQTESPERYQRYMVRYGPR